MKTIFTICLALLSYVGISQEFFVHTATAGTISADASFIDHPSLNGNPNAEFVISHAWNPPGSAGVYNVKNTGLFYSNGESQWAVYNEDGAGMTVDSSYFVYIPPADESFVHIATAGAQGSVDSYTVLNNVDLNGTTFPKVVISTYYNPNSLRNDHVYGLWYDDITLNQWIIYTEDFVTIPEDSAFMVAYETDGNVSYRHTATAGNITSNWTEIDHPLLNGEPDAMFVFSHNWGVSGSSSNVVMNNVLGAWYTGTGWAIFTEDLAAFPEDAEFDLIIRDPSLGVEDITDVALSFYPNPTRDFVTVNASEIITNISVFDILGKQVLQVGADERSVQLDLSSLATGQYMARVQTENASNTIKLVKN